MKQDNKRKVKKIDSFKGLDIYAEEELIRAKQTAEAVKSRSETEAKKSDSSTMEVKKLKL